MSYEVKQALDLMVQRIDEKVKQLEEALGAKSARTYDEYCGMCGEITGLLTARRYITDLTKNVENSDE
jgi:hypothetical protein